MSDFDLEALVDLIQHQPLRPADPISNENQILQTPSCNFNDSPDLPAPSPKSGQNQNLEIKGGTSPIAAAHASARCAHIKSNGIRCGSPALRDQHYCYFHHVWRDHESDHQPFRPDPSGIVWNLPLLENADGIQMAIQLVLDSVLCNKMELKRASLLLYGLQTAAVNVRRTRFDVFHSSMTTEPR